MKSKTLISTLLAIKFPMLDFKLGCVFFRGRSLHCVVVWGGFLDMNEFVAFISVNRAQLCL